MEANEIISSGLLELYVLGMANEQETAQVMAMLDHPEVAAELLSIEMGLEHYAHIHAVNPSIKNKQKVFDKINGISEIKTTVKAEPARVVAISSFWKYAAAASIVLFIVSAILNVTYYNKYETASNEAATANKKVTDAQQELAVLQRANDDMKNDMNVVQSRFSEPHSLNGLPAAPDAKAKIFWMKNTGDVYIDASNLPDAPEGMQYQFWGIVDGKPVDGGLIVITKQEDKYRIQKMKSFGTAEAFAVTLETKGGNPQPKGQMYVMGKM